MSLTKCQEDQEKIKKFPANLFVIYYNMLMIYSNNLGEMLCSQMCAHSSSSWSAQSSCQYVYICERENENHSNL